MTNVPDTDTINAFNKGIIDEFRTKGGKVSGQFENADLLLLTTTGAKSGQSRISPLAYFRIDGKLIISSAPSPASPVSPAWVHNLRANAAARVEIGSPQGVQEFAVTARELPSDERDALLDKVTAAAPGFAEYQSKTSRVIPLFELQRT